MELKAFFLCLLLLFLFFLSIFIFLKNKFFCNCEICRTYLTSSWSKDFNNLCDWYAHLLRNSPTQTIHIHVLGNTITANPDNVEHILKTRFRNYPKGRNFSKILGDLLGKGIFNVDGDLWIFQRKMASMELGSVSIRSYAFDVVIAEIKTRLLPVLKSFAGKSCSPVDLQDVFRRFSFDNICKFSFGLDPGCLECSLPISEFADSFDLATKLSAERAMASFPVIWKMKRFFSVGSEKKLKGAIGIVNVLAEEVIRQKRKLGFEENKDLLSRFMSNIKDDCFFRDIVVSFILAGRDTMSAALTSLFFLLASHPESVKKIRTESDELIPASEKDLATFEQIRELQYLHAAVYESLRLFPPVQFDSKFAGEDDVLPDGTVVKRGTRVTYHPYAMGRMEAIWGSDCEEFKPERWLNKGKFCPPNPYKYPVFQAGIRVCLGKEMAIMQIKSVALSIIRYFDFVLVNSGELRFQPGLTAMVRGGVRVLVKDWRKN